MSLNIERQPEFQRRPACFGTADIWPQSVVIAVTKTPNRPSCPFDCILECTLSRVFLGV